MGLLFFCNKVCLSAEEIDFFGIARATQLFGLRG
jgi:hypothetical protein